VPVVFGGAGALGVRQAAVDPFARDATVSLRPRRSKCRACMGTHVLLPDLCLLRRQYEVAVIGAVIEARAAGCYGYRRIAAGLGVPVRTVRRWLGRFACNAEAIRAHFTRWAFALDPELAPILPAGGVFDDALEAIGVAVRAWVLRLGEQLSRAVVDSGSNDAEDRGGHQPRARGSVAAHGENR
jgi:hypothetical protein